MTSADHAETISSSKKDIIISSLIAAIIASGGGAWIGKKYLFENNDMRSCRKFEGEYSQDRHTTYSYPIDNTKVRIVANNSVWDAHCVREQNGDIALTGKDITHHQLMLEYDPEGRIIATSVNHSIIKIYVDDGQLKRRTVLYSDKSFVKVEPNLTVIQEISKNDTNKIISIIDEIYKYKTFLEKRIDDAQISAGCGIASSSDHDATIEASCNVASNGSHYTKKMIRK